MRSRVGVVLLLLVGWPAAVHGQDEVVGTMRGAVRSPGSTPDSGWVALHRVREGSGEIIDSARITVGGEFEFQLPALPDPGGGADVYIPSVRWGGVLYFGSPVATVVGLDSLNVVNVYPPRPAREDDTPIRVIHRTVLLDRAAPGWTITEQLVALNQSDSTLVTGAGGIPTFTHPLAPGAERLIVGAGDVSEQAAGIVEGTLWVAAPMPPGERLLYYQYSTPDSVFDLPGPALADSLELFIAEPAPDLPVVGLVVGSTVTEGGRAYRHWSGGSGTGPVTISPGTMVASQPLPVGATTALLALVLTIAAIVALKSKPRHRNTT